MLMVISPAKKLDFESPLPSSKHTQPRFVSEAARLIEVLKTKSVQEIQDLMKLSAALGELNHERYQSWEPEFSLATARPAIFAFNGDVYSGLQAGTLSAKELEFAQQHLRILSGLYGVLRPLDLMRAYRLEMGTKLPVDGAKNLYEYWQKTITSALEQELKPGEPLINLASEEYFKAIDLKQLDRPVVQCVFQEERAGKYKIISFLAKKARGYMCRYIIENGITDPKDLAGFNVEGYRFDAAASNDNTLYFRRKED